MLLTLVDSRRLAVAVCLPALGSWWDFLRWTYCAGPITASCLMPFKPVPGAVAPFDVIQWVNLCEELEGPGGVPVVIEVDANNKPVQVLPWCELTFTLGAPDVPSELPKWKRS